MIDQFEQRSERLNLQSSSFSNIPSEPWRRSAKLAEVLRLHRALIILLRMPFDCVQLPTDEFFVQHTYVHPDQKSKI